MLKQDYPIVNPLGLHARPSAKLSQLAGSFSCEVWLSAKGRRVNAKSIMGVMMLAAGKGVVLTIETDGADAEQAQQALADLINSGFGELS